MPDLDFKVTGVEAVVRGISPLLNFRLEVGNAPAAEAIHCVLLRVQIQIAAPQREYNDREKAKLLELFGPPAQWGRTLRNQLWAHTTALVGRFAGTGETLLSVPCTYDLNIATAKYFFALEAGEVALLFLFSGTVFYPGEEGALQAQQIPWDKECTYRLPVCAWQELMDKHFPNSAWLYLNRDTFERLYAYKREQGLATWEDVVDRLLPANMREEVPA